MQQLLHNEVSATFVYYNKNYKSQSIIRPTFYTISGYWEGSDYSDFRNFLSILSILITLITPIFLSLLVILTIPVV